MNYGDENDRWIPSEEPSLQNGGTARIRLSGTQKPHPSRSQAREADASELRAAYSSPRRAIDTSREVFRAQDELRRDFEEGLASRRALTQERMRTDVGEQSPPDAREDRRSRKLDTHDREPQRRETRREAKRESEAHQESMQATLWEAGHGPLWRGSGVYAGMPQYTRRGCRPLVIVIGIAILIVAALLGGFALESCRQQADQSDTDALEEDADIQISDSTAESQEEVVSFTPTPSALDTISSDEGIQTFSLSDLDLPNLDETQLTALEDAVSAVEVAGDVGFVFYDLESGQGFALNPDVEVYGASSFKALYALYMCEDLIDTGELSLSDECPVSYVLSTESSYGNDGQGSYPVSELIEAAIISSDNNAFGFLRDAYDSLSFSDWITNVGADDVIDESNTSWFPTYCPRSSAKLWTEMYTYLNSESETAEWLGGLLTQTETSFIRTALENSGVEDITVSDKAGWISDPDPDYNAICDAGIIEADGHTYILSVMTGMPYGESNLELFETLVAAIFDTRESLNLQD